MITDENGYAAKAIERGYHYDKTFCDGHPAPVFIAVPEPEEDEETGEVLNSDAIEDAQVKNRGAARRGQTVWRIVRKRREGNFPAYIFIG